MNRQSIILELARSRGRVMVDELVTELSVSSHTVRRDINTLCEQSKLRRLHGGAEFISGTNLPYGMRKVLNADAKQAIALTVAEMIPDRATLFFSIGTTPAVVASALKDKEGLTVITNNLNAALAAAENTSNRVILAGGELRLPDRDLLGRAALDMFAGYRADYGIYGVGGIEDDGSLLDFHEEEMRIRQAIKANSRQSIIVADRSKFGRCAAAVGGNLREADHVVIDSRPDASFDPLLDEIGDRLIIAGASQ